ncbi:mannosyltransferase [Belliella sp. DSM 107340]|uniref:Mannosyltransferase n=2 Tax=Belliella calami TaxID=2923436 RepID=A0ABS9UIS1_9BACT|nr:mannosyltransferase [Belliella calami]
MSPLEKRCMASWKKYCPDFQIKLWNENNFDVNYCEFTSEAYKLGKYAFVSDVARLYALQQEGGIYMDTDMLLLKPFPENLLEKMVFVGKETPKFLNAAVIGSESNTLFLEKGLQFYSNLTFGEKRILIPQVMNEIYSKMIESLGGDNNQLCVLDKIYFYPLPYKLRNFHWNNFIEEETIAVHLWSASWHSSSKGNYLNQLTKKLKYWISKYYIPKSFLKYAQDN